MIPFVYNWSCGINYVHNDKVKFDIHFKKIFLNNVEAVHYVNDSQSQIDSEIYKKITKHRHSSYISAGIQLSYE